MTSLQSISQKEPLKIVGSTVFGRYPKISVEQTFNFIISDEFLVPYAAYKNVLEIVPRGTGRSIYRSIKSDLMIAIVGDSVYSIDSSITKSFVGNLQTTTGDIFISENNNNEIAITDGVHIYVYNYSTPQSFKTSNITGGFSIDFVPGYITFQNGRLICASLGTNEWRLSDLNNALSFPSSAPFVGELQTKPDQVVGAVRFPGRGNLLFVFGRTVTEPWNDVGARLFPYQRINSFNVDYGCLNPETIAENEDIVVWLAANEKSGPAIMFSTGTDIKKISTDGIDFKLSQLEHPEISYGFLFRQDGHLIYQITFPHPSDNLSYIYDFNTSKFFTVTDENLDYHIAKRVVFFNNTYYFVSFNDGNLYEFSTKYTSFQYSDTMIKEVPRIRITEPFRLPDQSWFIGRCLSFTIENGQRNTITRVVTNKFPFEGNYLLTEDGNIIETEDDEILCEQENLNNSVIELASERIDLSISRDGGETFGSSISQNMNRTGVRRNMLNFQRLGRMNDATFQLRFYGFGRFVATNGLLEVYQ